MADGGGPILAPREALAPTWDDYAVVVLMAGFGGSSIAVEEALGRHPDAALNHWDLGLGVHAANYPQTAHFCAGAMETDPRMVAPGKRIGLLWLSPDCRHFSPAKGSPIVSPRIRALAWVVMPWIILRRPDVIILENVEAFMTWGPVIAGEDGQLRAEMLLGRKPAEESIPAALSDADLAAIVALQSGRGWVALPGAAEAPLSPPARGVLVYGPGTLVLEAADGTVNPGVALSAVPVPFLLNVSVARRGSGNTAAVIGVR